MPSSCHWLHSLLAGMYMLGGREGGGEGGREGWEGVCTDRVDRESRYVQHVCADVGMVVSGGRRGERNTDRSGASSPSNVLPDKWV